MSNKNENNFCAVSGLGGLLKLDIMVHKAATVTYIWSFYENLENYRKLIYDEKIALWWKICQTTLSDFSARNNAAIV